jgi:DNA-binding transcriptional regulator GbsR (MarR family)
VPLTLDALVEQVGVSKGAVSINVRNLERLNMVHKHIKVGDRKDYFTAETDFWKIIKGILRERENSDFDNALRSVGESLEMVTSAEKKSSRSELGTHYKERIQHMKSFFNSLDNLVGTILALDELRAGKIKKLFKR